MATNYTNTTFKVFSDKMGGRVRTEYVGDAGEIFYDPNVPELFLSDGVTPGGVPILGSSTIDLTAFYTKIQVDQLFFNLIGGATANGDTLGELEDRIENNYTLINNLQNLINNYVDLDQQTLSFDVNTNILTISNGNSVDLTPLSQSTVSASKSMDVTLQWNQFIGGPQGNNSTLNFRSIYHNVDMGVDTGVNTFVVEGGRTYYISCNLQDVKMTNYSSSFEVWLVDASNTAVPLSTFKVYGRNATDSGYSVTSSQLGSFIYTPTNTTTLKYIIKNSGTTLISYEGAVSSHTIGG